MTDEVASVLNKIAEKHGVTVEDIRGKGHFERFVAARVAAAQELYRLGLTMREIGTALDKSLWAAGRYMRMPWTP